MLKAFKDVYKFRELLFVLAWKNITLRYKQTYFGIAWAVIKPLTMTLVFCVLRGFIDIPSDGIPYPLIAFSALLPWVYFQEATIDGVGSITGNAHLIKKIYFPREILPLTAVITRLLDFFINFAILLLMMAWFGLYPTFEIVWLPILITYTILTTLAISLLGAALNCYYRDIGSALPIILTMVMYGSPVIYPMSVVQDKLLNQRAAGDWSDFFYLIYTTNPLAGIIDAFQKCILKGIAPDFADMLPGVIFVTTLLFVSYLFFKRAESWFSDIV